MAGSAFQLPRLRAAPSWQVMWMASLDTSALLLQEDKENMRKELRAWRVEADFWHKQLSAEENSRKPEANDRAVDALNREIEKKRASIQQLKRRIFENEAKMMALVDLVVGDH